MLKPSSFYIATLVTIIGIFAVSCSKNDSVNSTAQKQVYNSTGIIKVIDVNTLKITIDHQDIPGFMSAMEMTFPAANISLLDGLAVGDKVTFVLERLSGDVTITALTKVTENAALNGSEIYAASCAKCHGVKGEGSKKGIPLISGHALVHPEEDFVDQVTNGEEKKMPAFRDKLSDEEIAAVVRYVREVIQQDVKKDGNTKHEH